ncbi:MAG: MFS transporter [Chloroflexota bacterium]
MNSKKPLSFRQLLPILTIVFVDSMGFTIVLPVVPFYALAFGAPPSAVGLLIMVYALAQFIFAPILGGLSDRYGRKTILTIAQIGTFGSLLLMGFAWALPVLFIARLLDGITGANMSTVQSAISDMSTKEDRTRGLGLVGAASGLGFVIGPVVGGLALRLANNNYAAPAFVGASFALLSILLTVFLFKETLPKSDRSRPKQRTRILTSLVQGLRSPELGPLYLFVFAAQFIFGMFTSVFSLFTLNRIGFNSVNNAIFFGAFGVMLMLMQGIFVGRWVKRFGEYRVLVLSFVMASIGFGIAAFTPQQAVPWYSESAMMAELTQFGSASIDLSLLPSEAGAGWFGFLIILIGLLPGPLGFTLQLPTINTLITKRTDPTEVGQALGMSASFVGAGTVAGPLLGGWLFEAIAPGAPFAISSILSVGILAVLMIFHRRDSAAEKNNHTVAVTQPVSSRP